MSTFVIVEIRTKTQTRICKHYHLRKKGRRSTLKNIICGCVNDYPEEIIISVFDSSMNINSYLLAGDTIHWKWCKNCYKIMKGINNRG